MGDRVCGLTRAGNSIRLNNPDDGAALALEAGTFFNPQCDMVIAMVSERGDPIGGVVYQEFTGTSIVMHVAAFGHEWRSRDMLWMAFHYPFCQLGVARVFGHTPENNTMALEFAQKLGFKIVAKIDGVFPGGACVITALAREDCRWHHITPRGFKAGSE